MKRRLLCLPLLMLILATLACASDQSLGALSANATPVKFTMYGEVAQVWSAQVRPGARYEIIVISKTADNLAHWIRITVFDNDRNSIASPPHADQDRTLVNFIGPNDGQVRIWVDTVVGEYQEKVGEVSIELHETGSAP
jgi:hypothetical protein